MEKLITADMPLRTSNPSITAALSINSILSDSLLVEILQRLPFISVLRAKSVCKHWLTLLSDPLFLQTFVRYHGPRTLPFTLVYEFHFWHRNLTDHLRHILHTVSENEGFQSRGLNLSFLPCFGHGIHTPFGW